MTVLDQSSFPNEECFPLLRTKKKYPVLLVVGRTAFLHNSDLFLLRPTINGQELPSQIYTIYHRVDPTLCNHLVRPRVGDIILTGRSFAFGKKKNNQLVLPAYQVKRILPDRLKTKLIGFPTTEVPNDLLDRLPCLPVYLKP